MTREKSTDLQNKPTPSQIKKAKQDLLSSYKELDPKTLERLDALYGELQGNENVNEIIIKKLQEKKNELEKEEIYDAVPRLKISEIFSEIFDQPIECTPNDSIELKIFKSALAMDKENLDLFLSSNDLDENIKPHILNFCLAITCFCRDIETLKFLIENVESPLKMIQIEGEKFVYFPPAIMACYEDEEGQKVDLEMIELLLKDDTNFNKKYHGVTAYTGLMMNAPEEYCIELFSRIKDVNELLLKFSYNNDNKQTIIQTSYVNQAISCGKFKLAKLMFESGAYFVESEIYDILDLVLSYNEELEKNSDSRIDFVKYLLKNDLINGKIDSDKIDILFNNVEKIKMDDEVGKLLIIKHLNTEGGIIDDFSVLYPKPYNKFLNLAIEEGDIAPMGEGTQDINQDINA